MAQRSITLQSQSPEQTESYAEVIGPAMQPGVVVELSSDLGGGKTTFVRGLARGFGSTSVVASPTFSLCRVYDSDATRLHHFDLYRLGEAGVLSYELEEALEDPVGAVVIEWAGLAEQILPADRLRVKFTKTGDTSRELRLEVGKTQAYLLENLL